ncbi:MAG: hypothetical protein MSG78_10880 [Clostridiales bacterium]|nr:hypothetical protein [Clostridiales bacterium]
MAKFGNFISKNSLPISEEEKQEFVKRISALVEKYDNTLKINVSYKIDGMLFISFTADKTRKFRNVSKSRISFNGISLIIDKTDGYLENFDWCKMEVKDKTKPEKDYESAPPFQYSATMWVKGEEIPYRCSTGRDIANTEMYQYGTEFDDIDFSSALWKLFNQELKPMEK